MKIKKTTKEEVEKALGIKITDEEWNGPIGKALSSRIIIVLDEKEEE